jgi:hypothetical protein
MTVKAYISQYGYHINTRTISKQKLKNIIDDLTVIPYKMEMTKEDIEKARFTLYKRGKSGKTIIVPRYYGIAKFGKPTKNIFNPEKAEFA